MFCPNCGSNEDNQNQFCRACGTNLSSVRVMMETPDSFATSKVSAHDEIGRAVAAKIQQTNDSSQLSQFAEEVLPEIEKFLESPEQRKLRRLRIGSTVSFVGLGVAVGFLVASILVDPEIVVVSAMGLITMFIGFAIIINGMFFTVPKKRGGELSSPENEAVPQSNSINATTNELLMPPSAQTEFSSVTENTTRHLKDKKPISNS